MAVDLLQLLRAGRAPFELRDGQVFFRPLRYPGARGATLSWAPRVRLLGVPPGAAPGAPERQLPIEPGMLAPGPGTLPAAAGAALRAEIMVDAQQLGGKLRDSAPTYVTQGKNLGRRNETNVVSQAVRDALGKYNAQARRAGVSAPSAPGTQGVPGAEQEGAEQEGAEQEGATASPAPAAQEGAQVGPPPMLARDLKDAPLTPADFARGVLVQPKLDGVRLVAFLDPLGGEPVLYSRGRVRYLGKEHLYPDIRALLRGAPPVELPEEQEAALTQSALDAYQAPRPFLDGELYRHGLPLNVISGQARREAQDSGGDLQYHVFDVFFPEAIAARHSLESAARQAYLDRLFARAGPLRHVVRVPTRPAASAEELQALQRAFLAEGYEGAVARRNEGYVYSPSNYHSSALLKLKPRLDEEFPIVGFGQGTGKDLGAVRWHCATPGGQLFWAVPNMELADRKRLFRALSEQGLPPGLRLTVGFAGYSAKTGKPLQPKGLAVRSYEEGAAADPIARLLAAPGAKSG